MRAETCYLVPNCDRCGQSWHDNPTKLRHDGLGFVGPCCRTQRSEVNA